MILTKKRPGFESKFNPTKAGLFRGGASRGICLRSPDNFSVISPLSGHNFGVSPSPAIFEVFFTFSSFTLYNRKYVFNSIVEIKMYFLF